MSVYVDNTNALFGRMRMSHMVADTHDELMEMARKIGVADRRLQKAGQADEHFDICKTKRGLAVKAGALECSQRHIAMIVLQRRLDYTGKVVQR